MTAPNSVTLATPPRIGISVQFDVVSISFHCGDEYEAQVLYDDIRERLGRGEKIMIDPNKRR